jgi:hypothetical protein
VSSTQRAGCSSTPKVAPQAKREGSAPVVLAWPASAYPRNPPARLSGSVRSTAVAAIQLDVDYELLMEPGAIPSTPTTSYVCCSTGRNGTPTPPAVAGRSARWFPVRGEAAEPALGCLSRMPGPGRLPRVRARIAARRRSGCVGRDVPSADARTSPRPRRRDDARRDSSGGAGHGHTGVVPRLGFRVRARRGDSAAPVSPVERREGRDGSPFYSAFSGGCEDRRGQGFSGTQQGAGDGQRRSK